MSLTPALENNWAKRKTIDNNRMGQVIELFYDDKNRLVMRRDYTGLAPDPSFPTTDTTNRPGAKLRASDPDYFETRYEYDNNSRKTKIIHPNLNVERFEYDVTNPDRRFHGNLLEHIWEPGPLLGDQATITESFTYEDALGSCCGFNFVKTRTDGRRSDGEVTVPPIQDTVNDYDANGNRTQTTHRDGGIENWTYNGFGQVTTHTLPDNGSGHRREDTYTYYPVGHPSYGYLEKKIVDSSPGGFNLTTTYEYDVVGNVTKKTDPRDNATVYVVNQLNQIVQATSRPVQTINPDGTIGPATAGYVRSTFYDENDNVIRVDIENRDELGNPDALNPTLTTTYEYDFLNFMTRKTEEVNFFKSVVTEYSYNKNKKLTQVLYGEATNGNQPNNKIDRVYDERNLLFTETRAAGDADQSTTQYDYDGNKNLTMITQGTEDTIAPRITTGTYDGYNRLDTSTDPNGNVATHHYDANHNRTSFRVDGELWDVFGSAGNVRLSEIAYAYDPMDRIIQGDAAFFDAAGVPINTPGDTTPGISRLTIDYSDNSQILSVIDDGNDTTTVTYDTADRRSVITDARTNTLTYAYDANSNVTQIIEADKPDLLGGSTESFTTTYDYDNLDRLITITDNVGNTNTHGYDSRNNRTLLIDALSNDTRYIYDGLNRLITTIRDLDGDGADGDGTDITTAQDWDDSSRLISRTDDNGNETRYEYAPLNRLTVQVFADCTQTDYDYDVHDNPLLITDANGSQIHCLYDRIDRLKTKLIVPGAGVADSRNDGTDFELLFYDGLSRLVSVVNDDSIVDLSYDSLSNVIQETQLLPLGPGAGSGTVTAEYDGESNLLSCTYPGGRTIGCTYDVLDRKQTISDDTTAQPGPMIADYKYVGRYRVAQRDYGNDTRLTYAYDGGGATAPVNPANDFGVRQVVGTTHTFDLGGPSPVVLDRRTYTWDKMYNKTRREDTRAGGPRLRHDYTYDPAYRLTRTVASFEFEPASYVTVRDTSYNLDGVHNRLSVIGTPGPATGIYTMNPTACTDLAMNKYTTTPVDQRNYDANGNLTSLKNDATGSILAVSCMYDYRNRMVEYRDSETGQRHTYAYDAFGRRIAKTIDADGVAGGPTTTRYFYSGHNQWQVCEEQDDAGTTAATYVYGGYIDEVLNMNRAGNEYYYHADDLFNVMAATDGNGSVVERYEYNDYGTPTVMAPDGTPRTSSAIANPYLFTGRRYDPESGWYNYRTRYLDPKSGKYTTRDVIGIWGDPSELGNGYSYVGNNPLSWFDPFGFCSQRLQDLIDRLRALADSLDDKADSKNKSLKDAHDWLRKMREVLERVKTPPSWWEKKVKSFQNWKWQVARRGFWMMFRGPRGGVLSPPLIDIRPKMYVIWMPPKDKLREAERQIRIARDLIRRAGDAFSNAVGSAARARDELDEAIRRCEEEDLAKPNPGGGVCGGDPP